MYTQTVLNIFKNPKNSGGLHGANGIGKVGAASSDIMKIYLKVDEEEIIQDAKFKTFGCVASIASSSVACEIIKGMSLAEALNVSRDDLLDELGELPAEKMHCVSLAQEAIESAVIDYYKRREKEAKKDLL